MKWVGVEEARDHLADGQDLEALARSLGGAEPDADYVANVLRVPMHLAAVVRDLAAAGELVPGALDSIPFYSLCRGLFLPLEGMGPEKAAHVFGLRVDPPPLGGERDELLAGFMAREIGLGSLAKVACILGDPFAGRPSKFRRESLLRLLTSIGLRTRRQLLDRLAATGDVAALFAESRSELRGAPSLTAAEVLATLRFLPRHKRNFQFQVMRSLLDRCGKVEAYYLAKLVMGRIGLSWEGELVARLIGGHFGVDPEPVLHAMALTDPFHVARVLAEDGEKGLHRIELQPLVPLRPALAAGSADGVKRYPVWVERKYDGIRLMLHKDTDRLGSMLAGAYSRNRRDYLEMVRGLDATIKALPARSLIVDGELYGLAMDARGSRQASLYEVLGVLQGDAKVPVQLRYAAFDLLYVDGHDLTGRPLSERRQRLQALIAPIAAWPLPLSLSLAEGQMASSKEDVQRLYGHFRAQGYEGIIAKDLASPYRLAARDPAWLKRKPEVTVDLVLIGAVMAVTTKQKAGLFGSYVLAARDPEGGYVDVGDVAGVDQIKDGQIQQLVMAEGLLTGNRIERKTATGARPGFDLLPHIVVTVKMSGVTKDLASGGLSLRDPKLVALRPDKTAHEANTLRHLDELYLKQTVG